MKHTENEAVRRNCVNWAMVDHERWSDSCLASSCMAWRWGMGMKQVAPPSPCLDCEGTGRIPDDTNTEMVGCSTCDGTGKVGHFARLGYCGLAGQPNIG